MHWVYFLLLLATDVCGLVLAAYTLPGLWLMLAAAAAYAWLTHAWFIGEKTLIALFLFALLAELVELTFGGAGAKKKGASRWGIAGSLIGAVVGGIFLTGIIPIPVAGTIIGICLGSFLGAFAVEFVLGTPLHQSLQIGVGAAKGRFTGIVGKVAIGTMMFVLTFFSGFPHKFFH
jgi:uncharacterized protein YqgC (DUF456 family)